MIHYTITQSNDQYKPIDQKKGFSALINYFSNDNEFKFNNNIIWSYFHILNLISIIIQYYSF
jgi:hypothetical protein